ncbi:MAG: VOC family protein [Polyangiaceae bacterium]
MKSAVVPMLRYSDAERAIAWLCEAFGFEVFLKVPGQAGRIEHARLTLEDRMIMLASLGRDGAFENRFRNPADVGGVTQCTSMFVSDPDRIYQSAKAAGARVIDEIADFHFGGRTFSCEDLESHVWLFTSHDPWQKIW